MNTSFVSKNHNFIKQSEPIALSKQDLAAARKAIAAYKLRDAVPTLYSRRRKK